MSETTRRLAAAVEQRAAIEQKLRGETGELDEIATGAYERAYRTLQHQLVQIFRDALSHEERIPVMVELIRIMENRLVYLHNFTVEPTSDNRLLASLVARFLDELAPERATLSPLELTYYRGILALYAGDSERARSCFRNTCESEESDETNDVKYKSYVILGNILHEERDYEGARAVHDESLKYSGNDNVTAQALAFKALNSYALKEHDDALDLFEQSLRLFRPEEPFYNSYFHRNALLFCGAIHLLRKRYREAEKYYREALAQVEPNSYDHFDALAQLGKICYRQTRYGEAINYFNRAIEKHSFTENEHLVDTCFWLARSYVKNNEPEEARKLLHRVTASDVNYERKSQAAELLQSVS